MPHNTVKRKYSVQEIDRMRSLIAERELDASDFGMEVNKLERITESKLRTYMLAGIDPEELERNAA